MENKENKSNIKNKETEKKEYKGLKAEKVEFNKNDVIATSGGCGGGGTNLAVGLCKPGSMT